MQACHAKQDCGIHSTLVGTKKQWWHSTLWCLSPSEVTQYLIPQLNNGVMATQYTQECPLGPKLSLQAEDKHALGHRVCWSSLPFVLSTASYNIITTAAILSIDTPSRQQKESCLMQQVNSRSYDRKFLFVYHNTA